GKSIASSQGGDWAVRVREARTGRLIRMLRHSESGVGVTFSPDGKRLVGIGLRETKVWDATTGQEEFSFSDGPESVGSLTVFSPDGERLGTWDGHSIKVWDTAARNKLGAKP